MTDAFYVLLKLNCSPLLGSQLVLVQNCFVLGKKRSCTQIYPKIVLSKSPAAATGIAFWKGNQCVLTNKPRRKLREIKHKNQHCHLGCLVSMLQNHSHTPSFCFMLHKSRDRIVVTQQILHIYMITVLFPCRPCYISRVCKALGHDYHTHCACNCRTYPKISSLVHIAVVSFVPIKAKRVHTCHKSYHPS